MDDAFALLRLQVEWGADEAIDPDPIDRMRPVRVRPAAEPRPAPVAAPAPAEPPRGTPAERALAAAGAAGTLEALRAALDAFDGCALRDTASHTVFAEGDPSSPVLLIGDPPGREEDRTGHPFAGPDGQLLDKMLASIGLTRAGLMLTPLVPWRPPGGRPVNPNELALCLPFLHRLIGLLDPGYLVLIGATACRAFLPSAAVKRRIAPEFLEIRIAGLHKTLPVLPLPGMSELLKTPGLKRDAWAGLRRLRRALDESQSVAYVS